MKYPAAALAVLIIFASPARAGQPSLSTDFGAMTDWLSHELAQGLAFNAGETFDPPHEVTSSWLQPDLSVGVGKMPLDKATFPALQNPTLRDMNVAGVFPDYVLFPNLSVHLRAGLPGRMDLSIRFDDMTTPPGYHISPSATGNGQSNSIGFGLRKHFFGGEDEPLLSFGGNFNHVFGRFSLQSPFNVTNVDGFSAVGDVNGNVVWDVSSFGLNAVLSQNLGGWIPFVGCGYNYVTGSVSANLNFAPAYADTFGIGPIQGGSSARPEQNQARVMGGLELDMPWLHFFADGEIKAMGEHKGQSWIGQVGVALPFEFGMRGNGGNYDKAEQYVPAPVYGYHDQPGGNEGQVKSRAKAKRTNPDFIFIQ